MLDRQDRDTSCAPAAHVPHPLIITPHPGEFARLLGTDTKTVQHQRTELAARFAAENQLVVALKGHSTVVSDGRRLYRNSRIRLSSDKYMSVDTLFSLPEATLFAQLVDHFESDGKRYVLARRNDAAVRGLAALTDRERQALGYAALGHTNKLIAYEMGIVNMRLGEASAVPVLILPLLGMFIVALSGLMNRDE